jgi:hypothetical protein
MNATSNGMYKKLRKNSNNIIMGTIRKLAGHDKIYFILYKKVIKAGLRDDINNTDVGSNLINPANLIKFEKINIIMVDKQRKKLSIKSRYNLVKININYKYNSISQAR